MTPVFASLGRSWGSLAVIAFVVLSASAGIAIERPASDVQIDSSPPPITDSSAGKSVSAILPSDAKARCRTSRLTQEKLVQMIHAIAMHGDLTDVAFIEKTLQTKLERYTRDQNLNHTFPNRRMYSTIHLLGSSIYIELDFALPPGEQNTSKRPISGMWGSMSFGGVDAAADNFQDCGHLSAYLFDQTFSEHFSASFMPFGSGHTLWTLEGIAKYNTTVKVNYGFDIGGRGISGVTIDQRSAGSSH